MLVVTGDRDNLQLIDDEAGVRVMMTRRGITDTAVYDEAAVQERYGVPPGRYIDLAALRGDPSDNLPGVPGVGDKTATKLVQTYGTAEDVVAHASEQRGKLKENLLAHGDRRAPQQAADAAARRRAPARRGPRPAHGGLGPGRDPPAVRHPGVPPAARAAVRDHGRDRPGRHRVRGRRPAAGQGRAGRLAGRGARRPPGRPGRPPAHRPRPGRAHRRRPLGPGGVRGGRWGGLARPGGRRARGPGGAGGAARRPGPAQAGP